MSDKHIISTQREVINFFPLEKCLRQFLSQIRNITNIAMFQSRGTPFPENPGWNWLQYPPKQFHEYHRRNSSCRICLNVSLCNSDNSKRVNNHKKKIRTSVLMTPKLLPSAIFRKRWFSNSFIPKKNYLPWPIFLHTPLCTQYRHCFHNILKNLYKRFLENGLALRT